MKTLLHLFILGFLFLIAVAPVKAVSLGQLDDFQDGTRMGWAHGIPGYLVNVPDGGPLGAGDNYLRLLADGNGSGGRLTTFNIQQWLGNYIAAGVNRIEIDLINQGNVSLSIRLAFKSQNSQNVPGYLSPAMVLPVGSGWRHFSIAITAANMIAVGGPAAFNTFFATGVGDFRVINEVGTSNLNGDFVVGQLGIDNIRAVPEPTVLALAVVGLLVVAGRRRFRRSQ